MYLFNKPMNVALTLLLCLSAVYSTQAENIVLEPQQGNMAAKATLPIEGQEVMLAIPETLGCREGLLLNFVEIFGQIQWEGPDEAGAITCSWSPGGRIEYKARLAPGPDYVDIEIAITNHTLFTWHDVWAFNCINPTYAPIFQDFDNERTYISIAGEPRVLKDTTRQDDFHRGRAVYLHEQRPEGEESHWLWNYRGASSDHTDDVWMALLSEPAGYVMAATSVDALFLFNNNTLSCLHSAPNFGHIGPGETSFTVSRAYFIEGDLETLFERMEADRPALLARQAWAQPVEEEAAEGAARANHALDVLALKEQHALCAHP